MNSVHYLRGDAHNLANTVLLVDRLLRLRCVGQKATGQCCLDARWHYRMWTVTLDLRIDLQSLNVVCRRNA
jgi:hypothetical protein